MNKLDLTYSYKLKVLVTDLKDRFLKPEDAIILFTSGDSKHETLSIQLEDIQITLDFIELLNSVYRKSDKE